MITDIYIVYKFELTNESPKASTACILSSCMSSVIRGGSCSIDKKTTSFIFCNNWWQSTMLWQGKWWLDVGETCVYGACILWYDLRSIIESTIPAEPLLVKSEDFVSLDRSASSGFLLTVVISLEQCKLLAVFKTRASLT